MLEMIKFMKEIRLMLERWARHRYIKKVAKMGEYAIKGFKAGLESVERGKDKTKN